MYHCHCLIQTKAQMINIVFLSVSMNREPLRPVLCIPNNYTLQFVASPNLKSFKFHINKPPLTSLEAAHMKKTLGLGFCGVVLLWQKQFAIWSQDDNSFLCRQSVISKNYFSHRNGIGINSTIVVHFQIEWWKWEVVSLFIISYHLFIACLVLYIIITSGENSLYYISHQSIIWTIIACTGRVS